MSVTTGSRSQHIDGHHTEYDAKKVFIYNQEDVQHRQKLGSCQEVERESRREDPLI